MNIKKNRYALLKIHKEQFNKYVFIFFLHFFFFLTLDLQASHQEALLYSTEHLRTLTHHPAVESRLGFSVLPKDSWSPGSNHRPSDSRAACSTAPPVLHIYKYKCFKYLCTLQLFQLLDSFVSLYHLFSPAFVQNIKVLPGLYQSFLLLKLIM